MDTYIYMADLDARGASAVYFVVTLHCCVATDYRKILCNSHGVYLCMIFEMSIWEFITNSKKNQFRNKLDFLSSSNLIFAGYTGSKNQVRTRKKNQV